MNRQTKRQRDRETERQTDRETDRQTEGSGEHRPFLRSVTTFGCTKIGAQILIDQLKI